MADVNRVSAEVETPVNPYSLLEAVNDSSDTAHTAWLIFIAIMTYLMIAVAGVTHKALLLETPLELPILQVQIPITQFFQFAPVVLVLFHLGLIAQLVLLARKTLEFDQSIRLLETSSRRSHPLRLELHNFFFVQAIAGPHRSPVMSAFLHTMSWLTLVILPVVLILYIQVVFLPYHSEAITWSHRIALLIDITMLILIGVFLMRAETSFWQALFRTTIHHPASFLMTVAVLGMVALFSLAVATVPGEPLDRFTQKLIGKLPGGEPARDLRRADFNIPFLRARADGSLFGFHRNLVVTDTDLVADKDVTDDEPSLKLRGRDLRYARLDRSDLHQTDFTGADLSYATLTGADLRNAFLHCASLDDLILTENRFQAKCVTARGANLKRARLTRASMTGIDLRDANLEEANLEAAELPYALLSGANFASAHLEKADMTGGIQAQATNFLVASLQGADLTGAKLQNADFSSASMQGALLSHAHLHGANMRDADMEAADLFAAKLHGADMTGAKIRAADLRAAGIWMTLPPSQETMALSDLKDIIIRPIDELDVSQLAGAIDRVAAEDRRQQMRTALAAIMDMKTTGNWAGSTQALSWQSMSQAANGTVGDGYRSQLTEYLGQMMCKARWNGGSVATGVARRAQTQQFAGDLVAIHDRLRGGQCPPGANVAPRIMQSLTSAADIARSN